MMIIAINFIVNNVTTATRDAAPRSDEKRTKQTNKIVVVKIFSANANQNGKRLHKLLPESNRAHRSKMHTKKVKHSGMECATDAAFVIENEKPNKIN